MPSWSEQTLQEALEAIENGMPVSRASKEYGISRGTLRARIQGATSRKERDSHQKLLSDYQESILANWVEVQQALGTPPSHRTLQLAAAAFLKEAGSNETPGRRWSTNFLARNPHLKTLQGKGHDYARSKGVEPDKIKKLFNVMQHPLLRTIRPQNRWNFDETGLAEG